MDWSGDIDEALQALKDAAPTFLTDVPALAPLAGFLPLFGIAMQAVSTIQAANPAASTADAVQAVAQHLTPGQPQAPALAPNASADPSGQSPDDNAAMVQAAAAAAAAPDPATVQNAITNAVATLPGTS